MDTGPGFPGMTARLGPLPGGGRLGRAGFCLLLVASVAASSCARKPRQPEDTATRGTLTMLVPESHQALFEHEGSEYTRLYPEARINISGTSTRDAIVQLLNGQVYAIAMDRDLNAEEDSVAKAADLGVTRLRIAEDALGVLVNRENPVPSFTMGTLDSIFHQRIRRWEEVPGAGGFTGEIELALTGRNSGLFEILETRFHGAPELPSPAFVAERQSGVRDYVASHPRAIGWAAIPALPDSTSAARAVPVEGPGEDGAIAPRKLHQANVYQGFYPLHYPLYLAYVGRSSPVAVGFGAFIASAPGQKIILNASLVPATMPVRLVQVNTQ